MFSKKLFIISLKLSTVIRQDNANNMHSLEKNYINIVENILKLMIIENKIELEYIRRLVKFLYYLIITQAKTGKDRI